jgi:hypothetical protein
MSFFLLSFFCLRQKKELSKSYSIYLPICQRTSVLLSVSLSTVVNLSFLSFVVEVLFPLLELLLLSLKPSV